MSAIETKSTKRGGNVKKRTRKPPPPPRPPVPIRVPTELVERIDATRDPLIPREPYVRWLIEVALDKIEEEGG